MIVTGILVFGLAGAWWMAMGRQPPLPRVAAAPLPVVRVLEVSPETVPVVVRTHGTVMPRTESDVVSEVAGRVVRVSPALVVGGFFDAGDVLLEIDSRDYRMALRQAEASVARWQSELTLVASDLARLRQLAESGVASASELDLAVSRDGVARARLREAEVSLDRAKLELARTRILAPFDGRVRDKRVDTGQFVSRGSPLARVYSVDDVEVRLPLPDRELAALGIPFDYRGPRGEEPGPAVELHASFAGRRHTWAGQVVRVEGEIDARSRMVHLVVRVPDPYGRRAQNARPPLAVGLFVEAEIQGEPVEHALVLPRSAVRGDGVVFVVDPEGLLRARRVETLHADRERIIVASGLRANDRVCASFVQGHAEGTAVEPVAGPAWAAAPDVAAGAP
jgi:RND family efflux transporter MFP subunit